MIWVSVLKLPSLLMSYPSTAYAKETDVIILQDKQLTVPHATTVSCATAGTRISGKMIIIQSLNWQYKFSCIPGTENWRNTVQREGTEGVN